MMTEAQILYFDSEYLAKLKKRKIKDGKIIWSKKEHFDIDNAMPLYIDRPWPWWLFNFLSKSFPFYVVKHNRSSAINLSIKEDNPNMVYYSPKTQKDILEASIISRLFNLGQGKVMDKIVWIIIGGVIGFLLYAFLLGPAGILVETLGPTFAPGTTQLVT